MDRIYSLAYLTSHRCSPVQAILLAAELGYSYVGLRLWPNAPGAPQQHLLGHADVMADTLAAVRDTGVGVFDLEIVRIGQEFDAHAWDALYDTGAALGAKALLVAGDDPHAQRLADSYAQLCEVVKPYGLTADLEFMPWTAVADANAALKIMKLAGHPQNAGILCDALHFGRSDTTLEDILSIPRHFLHYAQICDAPAGLHFSVEELVHTARCERLLPGEGNIDLKGLFKALPSDLPISIEIVNLEREKIKSTKEWAAQCIKASQAIIEPPKTGH